MLVSVPRGAIVFRISLSAFYSVVYIALGATRFSMCVLGSFVLCMCVTYGWQIRWAAFRI